MYVYGDNNSRSCQRSEGIQSVYMGFEVQSLYLVIFLPRLLCSVISVVELPTRFCAQAILLADYLIQPIASQNAEADVRL